MDPITAAVVGWSWWIWLSIGLVAVAAIIVGVVHYRTHRNAVKALQAGIEFFIGKGIQLAFVHFHLLVWLILKV